MGRVFSTVAAIVLGMGLATQAGAYAACEDQLHELDEIMRENDAAIPSQSLNAIFTLRQQAREACAAGAEEIADRLITRLADMLSADIDSARLDALR